MPNVEVISDIAVAECCLAGSKMAQLKAAVLAVTKQRLCLLMEGIRVRAQ